MNKNLIQIDSNNDCELGDILIKENELDVLRSKLNIAEKELSYNKANVLLGEGFNIVIIIGEIILYVVCKPSFPTFVLIGVMSVFYFPAKALSSFVVGTRIGRYIKNKRLKATIGELDDKIMQLEKTLTFMKEKANYKLENNTINESKLLSHIPTSCHDLSVCKQNNINNDQVKVLSLIKKNRI